MNWWIFQINTKKVLSDGKRFLVDDLKKAVKCGKLEWGTYAPNFYKEVQISDLVLIRVTKEEDNLKYSSKVVAIGKFVGTPEKHGNLFSIEFDKQKSQELLENPLDWEKVKVFLREDISGKPLNKTILPLSIEVSKLFEKNG